MDNKEILEGILKNVEAGETDFGTAFGLGMLQMMFGFNNFNPNNASNMLKEILKGDDDNIKELAKTIGISKEETKNAIDKVNEIISKKAEELGISKYEAIEYLS